MSLLRGIKLSLGQLKPLKERKHTPDDLPNGGMTTVAPLVRREIPRPPRGQLGTCPRAAVWAHLAAQAAKKLTDRLAESGKLMLDFKRESSFFAESHVASISIPSLIY